MPSNRPSIHFQVVPKRAQMVGQRENDPFRWDLQGPEGYRVARVRPVVFSFCGWRKCKFQGNGAALELYWAPLNGKSRLIAITHVRLADFTRLAPSTWRCLFNETAQLAWLIPIFDTGVDWIQSNESRKKDHHRPTRDEGIFLVPFDRYFDLVFFLAIDLKARRSFSAGSLRRLSVAFVQGKRRFERDRLMLASRPPPNPQVLAGVGSGCDQIDFDTRAQYLIKCTPEQRRGNPPWGGGNFITRTCPHRVAEDCESSLTEELETIASSWPILKASTKQRPIGVWGPNSDARNWARTWCKYYRWRSISLHDGTSASLKWWDGTRQELLHRQGREWRMTAGWALSLSKPTGFLFSDPFHCRSSAIHENKMDRRRKKNPFCGCRRLLPT